MNVTPKIDLSATNPFLTIWTRPRATIRGILEHAPNFRVLPIAMVGGILQALQIESLFGAGSHFSIPVILLIALVLGPPLRAYLLVRRGMDRRIELPYARRQGRFARRPCGAGLVARCPFWPRSRLGIIRIAFLGRDMFVFGGCGSFSPIHHCLVIATAVPEFVLSIWWMVVTVKALGEVQRFRTWRAFSSMLLLLVPLGRFDCDPGGCCVFSSQEPAHLNRSRTAPLMTEQPDLAPELEFAKALASEAAAELRNGDAITSRLRKRRI